MTDPVEFPAHVDARGTLVPVDVERVPFAVRRIFAVTGNTSGLTRGGHFADSEQVLILLSGSVVVEVGPDAESLVPRSLDSPGQTVELGRDDYVVYRLADEHSTVLVLASEPYDGHPPRSRHG